MLYNACYSTVYECIPEGDYTVCVFDDGTTTSGWFEFGDWYFDACQINGTCTGSGEQACQGGSCEDGLEFYVYTYGGNCNGGDKQFSITDVNTGELVWENIVNGCNSQDMTVCLPYGEYEGCVNPPFNGQGGQFQ